MNEHFKSRRSTPLKCLPYQAMVSGFPLACGPRRYLRAAFAQFLRLNKLALSLLMSSSYVPSRSPWGSDGRSHPRRPSCAGTPQPTPGTSGMRVASTEARNQEVRTVGTLSRFTVSLRDSMQRQRLLSHVNTSRAPMTVLSACKAGFDVELDEVESPEALEAPVASASALASSASSGAAPTRPSFSRLSNWSLFPLSDSWIAFSLALTSGTRGYLESSFGAGNSCRNHAHSWSVSNAYSLLGGTRVRGGAGRTTGAVPSRSCAGCAAESDEEEPGPPAGS
mmetsp:Transcript_7849/g.33014  ORF Transcript_7849/g.33014 Transcript_7849/m.33014 type:complete len:280 (-) Transcript_7849:1679-2518(-)